MDVLIDAVSRLDKSTVDASRFVIIGSGPEKRNLELRIKNLELQTQVKLLGKINSASNYLRAFDAFILPSRKEGFPYTILEAMQASLPIITTSVGGNKEALGNSAEIIEPENTTALTEAILKIFTDSALRQHFSETSKKRSEQFTESSMLEQTNRIYNSLL